MIEPEGPPLTPPLKVPSPVASMVATIAGEAPPDATASPPVPELESRLICTAPVDSELNRVMPLALAEPKKLSLRWPLPAVPRLQTMLPVSPDVPAGSTSRPQLSS